MGRPLVSPPKVPLLMWLTLLYCPTFVDISGQVSPCERFLGVAAGLGLSQGGRTPPYVHEGWFGQGDYGLGRLAEFLPQGSTDKTSKTFAILYWLSVTVTCYNNFFPDRCPFLFITNIAEIKLTGSKSYQQLIRHLSICMLPRYHSKLYLHKFVFYSYFSKVVYVLSFEVFPWFKKKR